jgi:hypothetical protein
VKQDRKQAGNSLRDSGMIKEIGRNAKATKGGLRIVAINLCVALLAMGFLGLIGEIYYRYFYDTSDSFALSKNARRWFERHYQYNNLDARDNVNYFRIMPPGVKRLVFLGDSFTAGHGIAAVDERFANIIRAQTKGSLDILVLAQGGFETGQEVFVLNRFIREGYVRGSVVLVYCLNDINDLIPESRAIHEEIRQGVTEENVFVRNSYFINAYYYRLRAILDPNISNYYAFVKTAYEGDLWEKQKKRLLTVASTCREADIDLFVVTFPFLNALSEKYDYLDIHKKLGEFWQGADVPHLDLLNVYQNYAPDDLVVSRFDAHPNELAHQLAADAILQFLKGYKSEI